MPFIFGSDCTRKDSLGDLARACGYRMAMKQASGSGQRGPAQVKIAAGAEDDLLAIISVLNSTAANSIARFETRPVSVAERRDSFGRFSATGPYRLVWPGTAIGRGLSCSSATGIFRLSGRPLRSASRSMSAAGPGRGQALYRRFLTAWLIWRRFMLPWLGLPCLTTRRSRCTGSLCFTEVGSFPRTR